MPVDVRQAMRYWLDRREMLWRRQHPAPGSYEEFLQAKRYIGPNPKYEDGYHYIAHPEDTEDGGSLYRMHMIRQEAAFELQTSVGDNEYITELDISQTMNQREERRHVLKQNGKSGKPRGKWPASQTRSIMLVTV
jgi:hypothetical protein